MASYDEVAFDDFVRSRSSALLRTAYLLTRDHQLAEDLLQTALFKAAKSWERIEGAPEPYVRRILYTENITWWRRRRHLIETSPSPSDNRSRPGPDVELRVTLERALDQLTPKQCTVLVLRYYEDLTEAETARVLHIGLGTVKSMQRQALSRLRVFSPGMVSLIGDGHE